MDNIEIKEYVNKIILKLFDGYGIESESIANVDLISDLGMDSIQFISLVVEIEQYFHITIPDETLSMENFRTVVAIVNIISQELAMGGSAHEIKNE